LILIAFSYFSSLAPLTTIIIFVASRIILRIYSSTQYKKIYFT
jgi:hypothetical protein